MLYWKSALLTTTAIAVCFTVSGCLGTIHTRQGDSVDFAGQFPYQAVATDVNSIVNGVENDNFGFFFFGFGLMSLPVDCVLDTLLLPADLVLWPCGFKKRDGIKPSF